jgi:peptidyl-Lys metalloendopeptidase
MNNTIGRQMKTWLVCAAALPVLVACSSEPGDGTTAAGDPGSGDVATVSTESPLDTDLSRIAITVVSDKAAFRATEGLAVSVTMTNQAGHAVRLLRWQTPIDGVHEPLFDVTRDGVEVDYVGRQYKRPAPREKDYVVIAAGESLTHTVDLGEAYDLSQTGSYTVRFHTDAPSMVRGMVQVSPLVSNDLGVQVEGRPSAIAEPEDARGSEQGIVAVGATTYSGGCTASEKTSLATALSSAASYAGNALTYLNGTPGSKPRYTTWFGAYSSSNWSTARTHFTNIKSALDTKNYVLDCSCTDDYYAYVYPTQPYKVYLCGAFWSAPNTGTDSRAGTIIHESSHFNVIASTDDRAYGQTACKSLAKKSPSKALDNADTHEYFAENTPAQN